MKHILKIAFLLTIVSCTSPSIDQRIIENNVIYPNVNEIKLKETLYVDEIGIFDSLIVLINRYSEPIFMLYDENFTLKKAFGTIGHAPDEFIFPFFLHTQSSEKEGFLSVYDVNTASFKYINVSKIQTKEEYIYSKKMPSCLIGSPNLILLEDSCFLGNMDNGQGIFFIHAKNNKNLKWINFPPILKSPHKDFTVMNMNRITVNYDTQEIVAAMGYYNLMFLYDIKGNLKKTIQIGEKLKEPYLVKKHYISEHSLIYSREIVSTSKYIYVLLLNVEEHKFEDIDNPPSKILVFDWDLNYVSTYQLPHYASTFAIDPSHHRIIYAALNEEGGTDIYSINL